MIKPSDIKPMPPLSPDIQQRIAELRSSRPYDGRNVTLLEKRADWRYTGISGICTRLAADRRHMVLVVEHDPQGYWPIGMEILAELDHESVPEFSQRLSAQLVGALPSTYVQQALQHVRNGMTANKHGAPVAPALEAAEEMLLRLLFSEEEISAYLQSSGAQVYSGAPSCIPVPSKE